MNTPLYSNMYSNTSIKKFFDDLQPVIHRCSTSWRHRVLSVIFKQEAFAPWTPPCRRSTGATTKLNRVDAGDQGAYKNAGTHCGNEYGRYNTEE